MEQAIKVILFTHAFAGGLSLLAGMLAILSKKGGKTHRKGGLVFFWAMMFVVATGIVLGVYRFNIFILTIAVFSFYMVFTGRRSLAFKKTLEPKTKDWAAGIICLLIALYMLYLGIVNLFKIGFAGAVPMLLVFGFFLAWMCISDLIYYRSKKWEKGAWLLHHIGRMSGSYIATSTAFLVVNISFQPEWIIWLLPTAVGTPLIILSSRKWRKKLGVKKK